MDAFIPGIYTDTVSVKPELLDGDIDKTILDVLKEKLEGKCGHDGFVRPGSVRIDQRSAGYIDHGNFTGAMLFTVKYECQICRPVDGQELTCEIHSMNNMGAWAYLHDGAFTPLQILLPRQLHMDSPKFDDLKEKTKVTVRVLGIKYQLNDKFITGVGVLSDAAPATPAPIATRRSGKKKSA